MENKKFGSQYKISETCNIVTLYKYWHVHTIRLPYFSMSFSSHHLLFVPHSRVGTIY